MLPQRPCFISGTGLFCHLDGKKGGNSNTKEMLLPTYGLYYNVHDFFRNNNNPLRAGTIQ